mmetsp:Transcript_10097/g.23615  ORF Transcript_10097/g.23615 Transcript_10097/m.23615 type:complete len:225 (-) Transcript_10097:134-808(-)
MRKFPIALLGARLRLILFLVSTAGCQVHFRLEQNAPPRRIDDYLPDDDCCLVTFPRWSIALVAARCRGHRSSFSRPSFQVIARLPPQRSHSSTLLRRRHFSDAPRDAAQPPSPFVLRKSRSSWISTRKERLWTVLWSSGLLVFGRKATRRTGLAAHLSRGGWGLFPGKVFANGGTWPLPQRSHRGVPWRRARHRSPPLPRGSLATYCAPAWSHDPYMWLQRQSQ